MCTSLLILSSRVWNPKQDKHLQALELLSVIFFFFFCRIKGAKNCFTQRTHLSAITYVCVDTKGKGQEELSVNGMQYVKHLHEDLESELLYPAVYAEEGKTKCSRIF